MRLRDLFDLIRLPNIFTAPTDVAMGMAVSDAAFASWGALLFGASALAYAGGMALNDACDAPLDAIERPKRPIPSGRVTRRAAFAVAGIFLVGSLVLAAAAGPRPLVVAAALVMMIVIYDARAKATAFGPPAMAACRALNAGLGIATGVVSWAAMGPAVLLFAYVLVLTFISRFEVVAAPGSVVRGAGLSLAAVLLATGGLMVSWWGGAALGGILLLVLLGVWLGIPLRVALADPSPGRIISVVKASVLGIILLDAAFVAAARGGIIGLAVAALFVPAYLLGRRFASA